jgi:hypothetical protein
MKIILKLAILVATMLLVTNMAFACDEEVCYDATSIYPDGSSSNAAFIACLNDDATGSMQPLSPGPVPVFPLVLFGDGPLFFGFDKHHMWTTWIMNYVGPGISASGYFWFTEGGYYLYGEGYTGDGITGMRWIMKGTRIPCPI